MELSSAQTLIAQLRGLSALSSLPSVAQAIAGLQTTIGALHATQGMIDTRTTRTAGSRVTDRPINEFTGEVPVDDENRKVSRSSSNAQGSDPQVPSSRRSNSSSVASEPSIAASSHRSSTLSQSGGLSSRLQQMQNKWASDVLISMREVLPITTENLEQSLHHDPSGMYQGTASTRVRHPTTILGEYLLPLGSGLAQTAGLRPSRTTSHQNIEATSNVAFREQTHTLHLQATRSSDSPNANVLGGAFDNRPQNPRGRVYSAQDLLASRPRDGTSTRTHPRGAVLVGPVSPSQQQRFATTTMSSQRTDHTNVHGPAPTRVSLTDHRGAIRDNTIDTVRRTNLSNLAPVNPSSQLASAYPAPIVPPRSTTTNPFLREALAAISSRPNIRTADTANLPSNSSTRQHAHYNQSTTTQLSAPTPGSWSFTSVTPEAHSLFNTPASLATHREVNASMQTSSPPAAVSGNPLPRSTTTTTHAADQTLNNTTNIASNTINTTAGAPTPLSIATTCGGDVDVSKWSPDSSVLSALTTSPSTTAAVPALTVRGMGMSASRWSTAPGGIASTTVATAGASTVATTPSTTASAFGGGVDTSRWSTATGTDDPMRTRRNTALEIRVPTSDIDSSEREIRETTNIPPSSGNLPTLRTATRGSLRASTTTDPGIGDTTPLFNNYVRPQPQLNTHVPDFILQAQAYRGDPGAAARAQYGGRSMVARVPQVPDFIRQAQAVQTDHGAAARAQYGVPPAAAHSARPTNENIPFGQSTAKTSRSGSSDSNVTAKRSKDPWDPTRRRAL